MKIAVFWVVAPCSLVEVSESLIALMMEAARTSETLVNFYQTTRCYNPEDSHLHKIYRSGAEIKRMEIRGSEICVVPSTE
jgi:hypothetical protein